MKYNKPNSLYYYKNNIANEYIKTRERKKSWKKEQEIVEKYIQILNIKNVLDVPFGTGRFVLPYLKKGLDIHGIEISEDMINEAKKILKKNFLYCNIIQGNSINLPYKNNSFDFLVCTRFLSAIISFSDVKKSLKEFSRVTKKYALLFIGQRKNDDFRERLPNDDEKMDKWLYRKEIIKLLHDSDFEIIEDTYSADDAYAFLCKRKYN